MSGWAGLIGGAVQGIAGGLAAGRSSKAQQREANNAAMWDWLGSENAYKERMAEMKPWESMETGARTSMEDILGYNGEEAKQRALDSIMNSPAVQMRLRTGTSAIDRSAAAQGGLFSGNTGKALAKYGQDLGSEEFGNEYNRRAGMMDWAYGNMGRRADEKADRFMRAASIFSGRARDIGAINKNKYDMLRDTQNTVGSNLMSFYGGGGGK